MKRIGLVRAFCLSLTLLWLALPVKALNEEEIPITVHKVSDRVIVLKETLMENNITAIASQKGLVIFDTSGTTSTAKKVRKLIEKEFGRNDWAYVINTHYHWDHAFGNQVFADTIIIGQEGNPAAMRRDAAGIPRRIESLFQNLGRLKSQLDSLETNSEEAGRLRTRRADISRELADLRAGYKITPPAITFNDRMTLDLGDLTLKLFFFGRAHSGTDIFIQIPEEHLLLTGDIFLDRGWLPLFAGQTELDIPRWIDVLHTVLDGNDKVDVVIPGHQELWSWEKLDMWRDYIVDLWAGVQTAKRNGLSLDDVLKQFPLGEKYFYLKELGHDDNELQRFQTRNIQAFWRQLFESVATVVGQTLEKAGIEAAIKHYQKIKADTANYLLDENQFNALGYQLLQANKLPEAIAIFKLNVEAFPQSWNVYDSLAEAYMIKGETEPAIKYYEKSLDLYPQNDNGREMLKRLKEKR